MKNKFKSYSFWTALAAAVVVLVEAFGRLFGFIPDGKLVADIIMAVAGVLVVLGVVAAPTGTEKKDESLETILPEDEKNEDKEESSDEKDVK